MPALAAGGLLVLATPAHAQLQDRYVAFALGTSQTRTSTLHLLNLGRGTDARFSGVRWGITPLEPTIYYSAKVGGYFRRRPRIGLEFDFTHNKAVAYSAGTVGYGGIWEGRPLGGSGPLNRYVQSVRFTNGVNILSLIGLYRGAGSENRLQPYVGIGPTFTILWSRNTVDGIEAAGHYHGAGWGYQALGGVRYRLSPRFWATAEATFTDSPGKTRTGQGGALTTPLRSLHQTLGIALSL
jgi:hypothetical protein